MEKTRRIIDKRVKEKFMMDDAYLNGFAGLCGWKATLVYLSLCRHANKDQYCFPSIKKMSEELAISESSIKKGIVDLKNWNVIDVFRKKRKNGTWKNNSYVLLDKSCWRKRANIHSSDGAVDCQGFVEQCPGISEHPDHSSGRADKETNKEGNKFKETHISNAIVVSKEVNEIMDIFNTINPTLKREKNSEKNACVEMIEKFGFEETIKMAEAIIAVQGKQYAPIATSPYEMKEKIAKFKIYFDRKKDSRPFV